ncbi:hypothetical protein [Streptomyces sp. NRRL S-244]|uniref:hypothetical protein n=1 Tax=Streptomyces sp. NRRL S-244 TaxID=1463897 RepID=UPI0004C1746D|nr:hypothetical protein [Streptomyces sp. NRRL S-244]
MGLFNKLTGTRRPDASVAPRNAREVREALLAVNAPDKAYVVRNARPEEKADLVAEWRILDPAWHTFFFRSQLERTLKIRMRLVGDKREVRALDEQLEVSWVGGTPRLATGAEYSRGQVTTVSKRWTIEKGPDGKRSLTEDFSFDTGQLKDPLRQAVLDAGWTWRGVLLKL